MRNMVRADLYRMVHQPAFYVCIGLLLLVIGVSIYTVSPGNMGISVGVTGEQEKLQEAADDLVYEQGDRNMTGKECREWMLSLDGYELDRAIMAHNINLYYFFIFVGAIVIAVDFGASTAKNTLTSAISRRRYFASKTLTLVMVCLILHICNTYLSYFANLVFNGKNHSAGLEKVTCLMLVQLPPVLALACILVGIAFVVRKMSAYNVAAIPFVMVCQLLFGYGGMLFGLPEKVMDYELSVMFGKLAYDPPASYVGTSCVVCAGIIAAFLALGYAAFQRSEIK